RSRRVVQSSDPPRRSRSLHLRDSRKRRRARINRRRWNSAWDLPPIDLTLISLVPILLSMTVRARPALERVQQRPLSAIDWFDGTIGGVSQHRNDRSGRPKKVIRCPLFNGNVPAALP